MYPDSGISSRKKEITINKTACAITATCIFFRSSSRATIKPITP